MKTLVLTYNHVESGRWTIADKPLIVGSGETAEIRASDPQVAPEHCRIELMDGQVHITDLGSPGGTLLNGAAVTNASFPPGAKVSVGSFELQLIDAPSTVETPSKDESSGGFEKTMQKDMKGELTKWADQTYTLEVKSKAFDQTFKLTMPDYTIGSDDDCDITVKDKGVAPTHLVLIQNKLGVRLVNVTGKSDIMINDRMAKVKDVLSANDIITIRNCKFILKQE
jgi:pSer/pThr/pTyr-binding forkhead associated (FHA) protein